MNKKTEQKLRKIIREEYKKILSENDIKKGDNVYWVVKLGGGPKTMSGTVQSIEDGVATISLASKKSPGKHMSRKVTTLKKYKNDKQ